MTLVALPGSARPFQAGHAVGTIGASTGHREPVDWLVDTGADWSAVLPVVAHQFVTGTPVNATTAPPGGAAFYLANGIDVEFTVLTAAGPVIVRPPTPVIAVKAANAGCNLLGMPELVAERAVLRWHAAGSTGELRR